MCVTMKREQHIDMAWNNNESLGGVMATILSEDELRKIVGNAQFIENGTEENVEGIKYDFKFGNRFLKAHFVVPRNYTELLNDELQYAIVEPGEVVFVLSMEKLKLPKDIYIQLSPKRSLAHDGIELLGGLTVDPAYEGYLVFGLYNVSGTPFKLKPGIKLVGANFYKLSENEIPTGAVKKPNSVFDFPERLQELIGKYKPVNPQTISEELKKLQSAFNDSQDKINDNMQNINQAISDMHKQLTEEISKREQESIRVSAQLSSLERKMENINDNSIRNEQSLASLKENIKETRDDLKGEIKELKADIGNIDKTFNSIKTWGKILAGITAVVGGIIGGIVTGFFEKIFGLLG